MIRRIIQTIVALSVVLAPSLMADILVFTIRSGNVAELKSRLLDAQSERTNATHLLIEGNFRLDPDEELPAIHTEVALIGHYAPARLLAIDGGPATLLDVHGAGSLILNNVSVEDFDLAFESAQGGVINNEGNLDLHQVVIRNNTASVECAQGACNAYRPVIDNVAGGALRLREVSIENSGAVAAPGAPVFGAGAVIRNAGEARLINVQLYLAQNRYEPPVHNSGQMWLRNVTFRAEVPHGAFSEEFIVSPGRLQVANSIVSGFASGWCESAISAGYNLVDHPDCVIDSREDIVGKSTGLRWQPVEADWRRRDEQLMTHALVPIAASPAVDSANEDWCPFYSIHESQNIFPDGRSLDGDGDGGARCDRGAFEIERQRVFTGGINGLYYSPDADGHYVYVADTRFNTMVMWTTFDTEGKQAWIFGIADKAVAGRSIIADAYINRDGRVSLSGQFDPATSEHWGRLEFELTDCDSGEFSFNPDVPGFASGQFEVTRLAHVKRLGCTSDAADE